MASRRARIETWTRRPALLLIRCYQRTLSFDHGPLRPWIAPAGYCKFSPSCSMYMYDAIQEHGLRQGVALGIRRILRCNPWHAGGDDPVPAGAATIKREGTR